MKQPLYLRFGKRCFDLLGASFGLFLISPLLVLVAIAVKLSSRGPALFRQVRVGRFGRPFRIFKFRSMRIGGEPGPQLTASGDPRVTPLGAWLRRTKIDELPQLFNVVIGDMSLVGPRPEVPEFTCYYTQLQRGVLKIRPGMTGPSANLYEEELLAGREDRETFYVRTVIQEKLEIDLNYCHNLTLRADLSILYQTFVKLLMRVHARYKRTPHAGGYAFGIHAVNQRRDGIVCGNRNPAGRPMLKSQWLYTSVNQMILDGCAFALSAWLAYIIRFDGQLGRLESRQLVFGVPMLAAVRLLVHHKSGIYRQVWKFISFSDVLEITNSIALVSAVLLSARFISAAYGFSSFWASIPISVIILEGFLSLSTSIGIRSLRRVLYARERQAEAAAGNAPPSRVFLYGAGRAGIMLRKELETNNHLFDVVGFIDDDPRKVGSVISKIRVVGNGEQLAQLVEKYKVDEVIISMATASRMTLSLTLAKCRRANVSAKIIPSLREIISGQVHISQFRDTKVEEVLGRESVEVNDFEVLAGATYRGKRVLVTGAGGSIGSEAVRQLIRLKPLSIAALDIDENAIFELEQELVLRKSIVPIQPLICNIGDIDRLRSVFSCFRPEIVIHAAAHKHVPLMELQPCEAILNNVGGTKNVLDISHECGVERFVFISSDKAVNPVNVMGATKRIGELLVQGFMNDHRVRLACVRFGNVLGSQGSVIPLFKKQIANGGPVTVTHPNMVRYFMTVQEAVQLVLCAGTLANGGETFVLDMGNPRNILELAREMILLAGLEPGQDIDTVITGLRPGEKLSEELVAPTERLLHTRFEKLSVIEPQPRDTAFLFRNISRLVQCARKNDERAVYDILFNMGLGYSAPAVGTKAMVTAASH
jgi:FlaA1/EpsC-like NDP-sugar epimerase/lipopolysaccharide/colanic/teichoic acid biosynthesis glycosyltransferase